MVGPGIAGMGHALVNEGEWVAVTDEQWTNARVTLNAQQFPTDLYESYAELRRKTLWLRSFLAPAYPNMKMFVNWTNPDTWYAEQESKGMGWMLMVTTLQSLEEEEPFVSVLMSLRDVTADARFDGETKYIKAVDVEDMMEIDWDKVLDILDKVP